MYMSGGGNCRVSQIICPILELFFPTSRVISCLHRGAERARAVYREAAAAGAAAAASARPGLIICNNLQ